MLSPASIWYQNLLVTMETEEVLYTATLSPVCFNGALLDHFDLFCCPLHAPHKLAAMGVSTSLSVALFETLPPNCQALFLSSLLSSNIQTCRQGSGPSWWG